MKLFPGRSLVRLFEIDDPAGPVPGETGLKTTLHWVRPHFSLPPPPEAAEEEGGGIQGEPLVCRPSIHWHEASGVENRGSNSISMQTFDPLARGQWGRESWIQLKQAS